MCTFTIELEGSKMGCQKSKFRIIMIGRYIKDYMSDAKLKKCLSVNNETVCLIQLNRVKNLFWNWPRADLSSIYIFKKLLLFPNTDAFFHYSAKDLHNYVQGE